MATLEPQQASQPRPAPARPTRGELKRVLRVGRIRLTLLAFRRHLGFIAFGAFFFVLGSFFAIASWGMLARDTRIEREGVRTVASISGRVIREDSDGDDEYVLTYTFFLTDQTLADDEAIVGRKAFETVEVGEPLTIAYDPQRPTDSFPIDNGNGLDGGMRSLGGAALFSAFGAFFAGIGGLFLWGLLIRLPSAWRRLLAEGLTARGMVTRIELGEENASQARLHYAFADRFGTHQEGETEWGPRQLVADWAEGDSGQVRYGRRDATESVWLGRGDLTFYR